MITAFQEFSKKHYQWLFGALLVVIIVSFVFAYSPGSRMDKGQPWHKANLFFGYDMADGEVVQNLAKEAAVGVWLKTGYPPYNPEELQTLVYERVIQMDFANRLGIPTPSAQQLGDYMTTLPAFQDDSGLFSRAKYDEFSKNFAKEGGSNYLSERLADRWRLDQVADRIGGAAYYLPESLKRESALRTTQYEAMVATLEKPTTVTATVSDEETKKYFDANAANYKSPEKREGVVYALAADKFAARVETPTEAQLQKYFEKNSFKFLKWQTTEDGKVTGESPKAPTYEENKDAVSVMFKAEKAARMAAEVVDELVQKIYADKIAPSSEAWNTLVKAAGLTAMPFGPIASGDVTDKTPAEATEVLFSLNLPGHPYSGAMQTADAGVFVLITKIEPSLPLAYEVVKAQVTTDAAAQKSQADFAASCVAKLATVAKAKTAEEFSTLAAAAGMAVETPKAFALNEAPAAMQKQIKTIKALVAAPVGTVLTDATAQQALAVYVKGHTTPEFSLVSEDVRTAQRRLGEAYGRMMSLSALNEWGTVKTKN